MSRIHGFTIAAVTALGILSLPASADSFVRRDVQVTYTNNSLATQTGAAALLDRIDHAAREACGGAPFLDPMYYMIPDAVTKEFATCHRNAVAKAVAAVGSPLLTHLYAEKGEPSFQRFADR
jgi:UrcA family protein